MATWWTDQEWNKNMVAESMDQAGYYLSGPMRGHPQWNFPAFFDAAMHLRRMGLVVVSPAEHDVAMGFVDWETAESFNVPGGYGLAAGIQWDLHYLTSDNCKGMIMLPDWEASSGANLERHAVTFLDKPVFDYIRNKPTGLPVKRQDEPLPPSEDPNAVGWIADVSKPTNRTFDSGANRDTAEGKPDYEGFLSVPVLRAYGRYMSKHRALPDGTLRDSDNWQKGIPKDVYIKSLVRHVLDAWDLHRGGKVVDYDGTTEVTFEDALCGVLFNASGYLHETVK